MTKSRSLWRQNSSRREGKERPTRNRLLAKALRGRMLKALRHGTKAPAWVQPVPPYPDANNAAAHRDLGNRSAAASNARPFFALIAFGFCLAIHCQAQCTSRDRARHWKAASMIAFTKLAGHRTVVVTGLDAKA